MSVRQRAARLTTIAILTAVGALGFAGSASALPGVIHGASNPPGMMDGNEGDFYISDGTNQIYGPKTALGTWPGPTTLSQADFLYKSGQSYGDPYETFQYINGSVGFYGSVSVVGHFSAGDSITLNTPPSPTEDSAKVPTTSWVNDRLDGYISEDTIDAKGDLLVGTGDGTVTRKGVGADGSVLTADSGATGGLAWKTPTAWQSVSTFQSGWSNFDTITYGPVTFMRAADGEVFVQGAAKRTSAGGTLAFTLPSGYRPSRVLIVNALGQLNGGAPTPLGVDIHPNGQVIVVTAPSGNVVDFVSFTTSFMAA